jgi:hypothetical protein
MVRLRSTIIQIRCNVLGNWKEKLIPGLCTYEAGSAETESLLQRLRQFRHDLFRERNVFRCIVDLDSV